ncbi:MAG: Gfo/Idh/MocA family oxidoreductase [Deltaproteobacteria bacterium]|nr:Gfo/Idh/MocA family oxidoreductase [Deltaproteobacteria bacterium]
MTPIRFGLIGAGKHGSRYAKHIVEDIPQAQLVALCRRDRREGEQLAARYGCDYYTDYRQLLDDGRIDAVAIAVPPALHGMIVPAACQAGKHILLEKPFAVSVAEGERLRAIIATSGVRCMVAHTLRFNVVVQTFKKHIAEIAPLHSFYLSQRFEPSPLLWLDRKAESGGGIILHTGVHSFDLLRFLSGYEVTTVHCEMRSMVTRKTEDNFTMLCQLRDPATQHEMSGAVAGSRSTASRSGLIELSGEHGQLVGDHHHGFAYLLKGTERISLAVAPAVPTVREVIQSFVDGIHKGTAFPITPDDGLRAVAIAEACYRSAGSGQRVPVLMRNPAGGEGKA